MAKRGRPVPLYAMRFAPTLSSLQPSGTTVIATLGFAFEAGPFSGRSYLADVTVCPSPCCGCDTLCLRARTEVAVPGAVEFTMRLSVGARGVAEGVPDPEESGELAAAFVAEQQAEDWDQWERLFLAAKRHQMATMDLERLTPNFPPEVLEGDGSVVAYREIFPWDERRTVALGAERWELDDMYCVDRDCDCHSTRLVFVEVATGPVPAGAVARECSAVYDYARDRLTPESQVAGCPAAKVLGAALRAAYPECSPAFYRRRHGQMRSLAERLIPAAGSAPLIAPAKVGRNDLCPAAAAKSSRSAVAGRVAVCAKP